MDTILFPKSIVHSYNYAHYRLSHTEMLCYMTSTLLSYKAIQSKLLLSKGIVISEFKMYPKR
jgi:hypothetical protein